MIDRKSFFDHVRKAPAAGALTAAQVEGFTNILDEWEQRGLSDVRHLAYMLATVWHETGSKMQPIREGGSKAYLEAKPYYPWTGRGLVQVTWEANGRKFGARAPDDLLSWPVAIRALFDGMIDGVFTGKKLSDYFNSHANDPLGARRIINGTDKSVLIAGYHKDFLLAIGALAAVIATAPAVPPTPGPIVSTHVGVPAPAAKQGFWASLWSKFTGKAA